MTIKSILVVVSGTPGETSRLKRAFALAKHYAAGIAVLHVKPSAVIYLSGAGGEIPASIIERQQQEIDKAADELEAAARAEAAKADAAIEWRCEEGGEVDTAGIHARYADLVIASPELARDLVFVSGTPVLAVPDAATAAVAPRRVLVAWNGSREAARAVRDALPLLAGTDSVTVIVVDPPAGKPIGEDLGRLLAKHGIQVDVRQALSGGAEVGGLLLAEAKTGGCDLLVMGAYGHSRFREWVLGGATEEVLQDSPIPVLLSH